MQTFLPYEDFGASARALDSKRLGKQRSECLGILKACYNWKVIPDSKFPWKNHPAVLQWVNHERWLIGYTEYIVNEWQNRGYKDNGTIYKAHLFEGTFKDSIKPSWLGYEPYHASHRAALLAKNFEWYKQFKWKEEPKIEYVWPIRLNLKELAHNVL